MGSLLEMQAQHTLCSGWLKYFVCIFIKGMKMPINRTFGRTITWGIIPTPNLIKFIYLESWLRV